MSDERIAILSTHQVHDVESLLDHILFLDIHRLLMDKSIGEITDKYTFEYRQPQDMADVLYAEPTLQGNAVIARRQEGQPETQINLELLFSAAVQDKLD
jgi:ABC-2 type transport system ATP-binding protein